ncbi:hypothetical protein [Neotabrizicola sp. sgz301269]|uniref:hypothetical protein n=1 Tax=Neotabrizicola sp. sgz301269 TaxID=3276282 RepID=UPI0037705B65
MTLNEFKAWLEGFEAAMGDAPTPEQWKTIKAKLAGVSASGFDLPKLGQPYTLGPSPSTGHPHIFPPYVICSQIGAQDPTIRTWNGDEGTRTC